MGVDIVLGGVGRRRPELEPARRGTFGAEFGPAQEIALGDHADRAALRVDHRQAAHAVPHHELRGMREARIRADRGSPRRHDVSGLHRPLS
jgi:hypothetical protein